MPAILAALPGKTIAERAKLVGVSRQSYYYWLNGGRPGPKHAWRIAKLTGHSLKKIMGL